MHSREKIESLFSEEVAMTGDQYSQLVNAQYGRANLSTSILAALQAIGKGPGNVTLADLAPLDHYHGGGYPATLELARRANLQPGQQVLDVGGGIGGPARTLAAEFGCTVTVLDLTEEFCRTGELLTTWTNLSHQVTFQQGNALALPFPDQSFDVVWAENSFMNIADKEALYAGIYRVLRTGGRFAFQEVMAGPVQPIHFPVPWANSPAISFLRAPAEVRTLLQELRFHEVDWADITPAVLESLRQRSAATSRPGTAVQTLPNLSFILRPREEAEYVAQNMAQNLEEGRVAYIQAVFDRL
jgi:ubiquinone/menaquinone biosynthesis C-methylase UbiE